MNLKKVWFKYEMIYEDKKKKEQKERKKENISIDKECYISLPPFRMGKTVNYSFRK